MASYSLQELAELLGGVASETPGPRISGARPLEYAQSDDITYLVAPQFMPKLAQSGACAVLVPHGLDPGDLPCIRVDNPEAAFAKLTAIFYPYPEPSGGVSSKAEVHPEAILGSNVSIGPFCFVDKAVRIGDNSVLGAHVVVGEGAQIGRDTKIFPNVTIYPSVKIGDRVIIHSGSVIGSDGFGYAREIDKNGAPVYIKKFHSGTVEIGDDVEIGALVAIDRALAGVTKICNGAKLDNLIQIAHNVHVGEATVIASQAGIAGSSSIGRFGMIGGQAGVKDHVSVGDGVVLATRVGIYRNVPSGSIMAGSVPAMPHKVFLRAQNLFKRLPELLDRIKKLESLMQCNRKGE